MAERARKVDNPALRADVERLRRAGKPLDRKALAHRYGVSVGTVQAVRSYVDSMLAAEQGTTVPEFTGGRLVLDFDGHKLFALRRQRFLMQEELADLAQVSRGEVGHLERQLRKPTLKTLRRLADALAVDPADLLAGGESIEGIPDDTERKTA